MPTAPGRPRPTVAVGSLGGTITMTGRTEGGATPTLDAGDLVASVPGLAAMADVSATTLLGVPSASLTTADVLRCLPWARSAVAAGASGVVLVQGTDTLEESAYLLDLFWDLPEPLVVTGAMRTPDQAGADGPANLLAAATVAAAPSARDRGVLVVLDDEVHAASRVRKQHSTALGAFVSPATGPLGSVVEGRVHLGGSLVRHRALGAAPTGTGATVPLLEATLGDTGELLRVVARSGVDGIVLAAFGVGHVSAAAAEVVADVAAQLPVVVASRTGAGPTHTATYGFPGSESDLLRRGALMAGWLDPRKARVLLWALLAGGASRDDVARELALRGRLSPG
jgi:L-asparaginase